MVLLACNSTSKATKSQVSAEEIYKLIEKGENVYFKDTKILGNLDLTILSGKTAIRTNENKVIIRSSIAFYNCRFTGEISGYKTDPGGKENSCIFLNPVFFHLCVFEKTINLKNAVFQHSCILSECTFNKDIVFDNCQAISDFELIKGKVLGVSNFQNAYFNQKTNFFKTQFDSTCLFQSGFFNSVTQFNDVVFKKYTDFSLSTFNSKSFFNYAKFYDRGLFNNCSFRDQAEFNYAHFNNVVFEKSSFNMESKFSGIEVENKLDLSSSRFLYAKPFLGNDTGSINKKIIL